MKITIEEKSYNFGDEIYPQINSILRVLKEHKEKGDNICTISFVADGKKFYKEFKNMEFLANFLAGVAVGEIRAMEKLAKDFLE